MELKYLTIRHSKTVLDGKKRKESELAQLGTGFDGSIE